MKFMNEPNVSYTAIPSAVLVASLVLGWVYLNRPFRKSSLIVFTVSVIAFTIKLSMMSLGSILPMLYIGIEWIWLVSFIVAEALMIINVCKAKKQTAKDNNKTENQQ